MCAIHGITWADPGAAMLMCDAAKHRGPHGYRVWHDHQVTLGHNLLAVTDVVENSRQPLATPSGHLVFNGEVYNHVELRGRIEGHTFRTDSDTETLAAGLAEHGPDFLKVVDGMFALAWYDHRTGLITLARDPDGSRPLYYAKVPGRGWAFSTEVKSLRTLGVGRAVSKEAFRHYYHAGLVNGPLTLFEGIYRLVPGQVVQLDIATGADRNLPNLNARAADTRSGDLSEAVRSRLGLAVAATAGARRKTGLLLSGGMDSGAIFYEAAAERALPLEAFSTRFDLPHHKCRHNEDADLAADLAGLYEVRHRHVHVGEAAWVGAVEKTMLALEEPRQSKSLPAYYLTLKAMSKAGVIVALSGDGGDELLGGYKHHRDPPYRNRLAGLRANHRELSDPSLHLSVDEQEEYLADWLPKGPLTGDPINDLLYTECMAALSEDFLVRSDKLGAAFGMESRFPMLCRGFKGLIRGVPGELKLPMNPAAWATAGKPLLRDAYRGRLPDRVTARAKTGWRAPTDDWLIGIASCPAKEGPMREYVRETLRDPVVRELFGITDDTVENLYLNNRDFAGPKPGTGPGLAAQKELFGVLMFATWFKVFDMNLW